MVDRRKRTKSVFDTSGVRPGSRALGVQPEGGLGIALLGLGIARTIPSIVKGGRTLWALVKDPATNRLVIRKLDDVAETARPFIRKVLQSTAKKAPTRKQFNTKGVTANPARASTQAEQQVLNRATIEAQRSQMAKEAAAGAGTATTTNFFQSLRNAMNVGALSKTVANKAASLATKIKNPRLLNLVTNTDAKRAAMVTGGVGGVVGLIALLSGDKKEEKAATDLNKVLENHPVALRELMGYRKQAEEARGVFRTEPVLDDMTARARARIRGGPAGEMGRLTTDTMQQTGRNIFEDQRRVARLAREYASRQPRVTETRGTEVVPVKPRQVSPGIKPFRTPEDADVISAYRYPVPVDDTIAEDIIGQKLFGLRRTKKEIDRDILLTRSLGGQTVTYKGKRYKPGQIDDLVEATRIAGPSKTERTRKDPDRVKTVREDVARVLRPKKRAGGKVYASKARKPRILKS